MTALILPSWFLLTVESADTVTELVVGSTAQAVPGMEVWRPSLAVALSSWRVEYLTTAASAPLPSTLATSARSVTLTTTRPELSMYDPAALSTERLIRCAWSALRKDCSTAVVWASPERACGSGSAAEAVGAAASAVAARTAEVMAIDLRDVSLNFEGVIERGTSLLPG